MAKVDMLYMEAGEALHAGQTLEMFVRLLVTLMNEQFDSDIDDALVLRQDKRTLGRLITELKKRCDINDEYRELLDDALEKRNYIAHNFFNENVHAFSCDETCEQALKKLHSDAEKVQFTVNVTQQILEKLCQELGIETDDIHIPQSI